MHRRATRAAAGVLFLPLVDCSGLGCTWDYTPCRAVTLRSFFHGAEKGNSKAGEELTDQPETDFVLPSTQTVSVLPGRVSGYFTLCLPPTSFSLPSTLSLLTFARQTSC